MPLVPMDDTGQRGFVAQLAESKFDADRAETDTLCGIADTEQRHALTCGYAPLPHRSGRVELAVILAHDTQTRGTAVHRIQLAICRKRSDRQKFFTRHYTTSSNPHRLLHRL